MDTKLYLLRAELLLTPVWHNDAPEVIVGTDDNIIYAGKLFAPTTFKFDQELDETSHTLWVEFINKTDSDTIGDSDKAVKVDQVTFNNITSPKFSWAGVYEPRYPEPWASEQRAQGVVLQPQLNFQTYLGWNGKWTLTFTMPIFTWIHHTEGFGWIYN